jgi:hypothetical protein
VTSSRVSSLYGPAVLALLLVACSSGNGSNPFGPASQNRSQNTIGQQPGGRNSSASNGAKPTKVATEPAIEVVTQVPQPKTATPAPLTARELFGALLAIPFGDRELPQGYSAQPLDPAGVDEAGLSARVSLKTPDTAGPSSIGFTVFASADQAMSALDAARPPDFALESPFPPKLMLYPTRCGTGSAPSDAGAVRAVACFVVVDNVVVAGYSRGLPDKVTREIDTAESLAYAGMAHLKAVRLNPDARKAAAARTPIPTPTPGRPATPTPAPIVSPTRTPTQPPASATRVAPTSASASATAAGSRTPPKTPQDLVNYLLSTPFTPAGALPAGFSVKSIGTVTPDASLQQFHVVGVVAVQVEGPDQEDDIFFYVYATDADARSRFDRAAPATGATQTGTFSASLFTKPSKCTTATLTSGSARYGSSTCDVLVDNVEVIGVSVVASDTQKGNNINAINLAAAGNQRILYALLGQ